MVMKFPVTDHRGAFIPPGRTLHKFEFFPKTGSVIPEWLTITDGIMSLDTMADGRPGIRIANPNNAKLAIGGAINRSTLHGARLTAHGVYSLGEPNTHTVYLRLDDAAATDGAVLTSVAGNVPCALLTRTVGGTGTTTIEHQYHTVDNQTVADVNLWEHRFKAADISLLVNFEQGNTVAMERDSVVGFRTAGIGKNIELSPRIQYSGSSTKPLLIQGVSLELWYN